MIQFNSIFACLVTLGLAAVASAGVEVGNGGDAVVCRNQDQSIKSVELLDYYEARVEKGLKINLNVNDSVEKNVKTLIERISIKDNQPKQFLNVYMKAFANEVKFLPNTELVDIPDSHHMTFPSNCRVEQLAIQKQPVYPQDPRYTINQDLWEKMDSANQAGLIMHELLYRRLIETYHKGGSEQIRYINALLAADVVKSMKVTEIMRYVYSPLKIDNIKEGQFILSGFSPHSNDELTSYCASPAPGFSPQITFGKNASIKITLKESEDQMCYTYSKRERFKGYHFYLKAADQKDLQLGHIQLYKVSNRKLSDKSYIISKFSIRTDLDDNITHATEITLNDIILNGTRVSKECDKAKFSPEPKNTKVECLKAESHLEKFAINASQELDLLFNGDPDSDQNQTATWSNFENFRYKSIMGFKFGKEEKKYFVFEFYPSGNVSKAKSLLPKSQQDPDWMNLETICLRPKKPKQELVLFPSFLNILFVSHLVSEHGPDRHFCVDEYFFNDVSQQNEKISQFKKRYALKEISFHANKGETALNPKNLKARTVRYAELKRGEVCVYYRAGAIKNFELTIPQFEVKYLGHNKDYRCSDYNFEDDYDDNYEEDDEEQSKLERNLVLTLPNGKKVRLIKGDTLIFDNQSGTLVDVKQKF